MTPTTHSEMAETTTTKTTEPGGLTPALLTNAVASLGSGLLLTLGGSTVAGWLDVSIDGWLRILGLVLLGHGALLIWAARRPAPQLRQLARLNLMAIAPYPLLMIAVVATGLVDNLLGRTLVLVDGAVIAVIAVMHWSGLRTAR